MTDRGGRFAPFEGRTGAILRNPSVLLTWSPEDGLNTRLQTGITPRRRGLPVRQKIHTYKLLIFVEISIFTAG